MSTTLGSSLILPSIMQWKRSSQALVPLWHCSHLDLGREMPPHALTELADVGLHPPISPLRAELQEPEALDARAGEQDEDRWMDSPPADQQQQFTNSSQEEEAILQEWSVKSMCLFPLTL